MSVAEAALKAEGLDLVSVYPIADDYEEKDVAKAVAALENAKIKNLCSILGIEVFEM